VGQEEASFYTSSLRTSGFPHDRKAVSEKPTPQSREVSCVCAPLHLEGFLGLVASQVML
jgi:hypothetical protein